MMLERKKQLEVLNNDVAVLEALFGNKDGDDLVYPGDYMPDGNEFRISLKGVSRMTNELRERMVQLVRGQYNAREDEQNAPKVRQKESSGPTNRRGGSAAEDGERGNVSTQDPTETYETGVEEFLQTREERLRKELEGLDAEVRRIRQTRDSVARQLERVQICILALQEGLPITSGESSIGEVLQQPSAGSTRDSQTASPKRTTKRSTKNSRKGRSN